MAIDQSRQSLLFTLDRLHLEKCFSQSTLPKIQTAPRCLIDRTVEAGTKFSSIYVSPFPPNITLFSNVNCEDDRIFGVSVDN